MKRNQKRKEDLLVLKEQLKIATQNMVEAEARLKAARAEDAATIDCLKQELVDHENDAETIAHLKSQLEGHAKDGATIKRLQAELGRAQADEALAAKLLRESKKNEETLNVKMGNTEKKIALMEKWVSESQASWDAEKRELVSGRDLKDATIKTLQSDLADLQEKNTDLGSRIVELEGRLETAPRDYLASDAGERDLNRFALMNVRPFSKLLAAKFPSRRDSCSTAAQTLIDQHYSRWFWPLPGPELDVKFSGCSEFKKYWPPEEGTPPPPEESSASEAEESGSEDAPEG